LFTYVNEVFIDWATGRTAAAIAYAGTRKGVGANVAVVTRSWR